MKSILPAFILSLISAAAIAQSPAQKQDQAPAQTASSLGALKGGSGAAAASYAATGRIIAPDSKPADSTKTIAERRRVEVLKSNKTGDPNDIAVNPLYSAPGNTGENPLHNPASRAINESGVSVKPKSKNK